VIQVEHRTAPTRCASLPRKLERGLIFLENVAKKQTKWFISQILYIYTKVLGTDRFGTPDPYRSGPYGGWFEGGGCGCDERRRIPL